ncbi:MAG: DUF2357 domain-containing protein [Nitrospiraceae bacterium]|nr:DUF2357 domain-containing protein [Nitrospiraceae bacterium]
MNRSVSDLRNYLRKTTGEDQEFDKFLHQVDVIIKLRLSAEQQYKSAPHLAYSRRSALPLDWKRIYDILYPGTQSPPESLITSIARSCVNETESLIGNMRKVLLREREKVSLGMVQQVDPHCLRWLSKQPGRNAIEKAGTRQKILAIVRRENFNTLENRVFKDFLARTYRESVLYLQANESYFNGHPTINRVKRLRQLCAKGLQEQILETVSGITKLPTPNYVLRQERRYAKIWKAYCELLKQAHIAERLWLKKDELNTAYEDLHREANIHINSKAKYRCPIWFNPPDGRKALLDQPFYLNDFYLEPIPCINPPVFPSSRGDVVIDLTGQQPDYDLLIYGRHKNAKPYLQNYSRPSIEDLQGSNHVFLRDLLKEANADNDNVRTMLCHYFEQLKGKIGGNRWFVLIPDDWDAFWQEAIIKSIPLARSDIFLLWRSVAATIGVLEQLNSPSGDQTVAIIDIQQGGVVRLSTIFLVESNTGEGIIPQRKSYMRHKNLYNTLSTTLQLGNRVSERDAFLFGHQDSFIMNSSQFKEIYSFCQEADHTVLINNIGAHIENSKWISQSNWLTVNADTVHHGVRRFIQQRDAGQVPYYDELEALSLIVQTEAEQIVAKTLVPANEHCPGGQEIVTDTLRRAAVLRSHSTHVDLYLCMGDAKPTSPLKKKKHDFLEMLEEDHALDLSARITPGQGMAVVTVMSNFLREPIELDFLQGMEDSGLTIADLENRVDRSFPPDAPYVESDFHLWHEVKYDIQKYLAGRIEPEGKWFAKARGKYAFNPPPKDAGPLERLRRINVFGNREGYQSQFDCDRQKIFSKLSRDFNTLQGKPHDEVTRLIAWTYASHESGFYPARKEALTHLLDYAEKKTTKAPGFPQITLCANLCVTPKEWALCLKAIELRIKDQSNSITRDFYLLYNLLQFHPTLIFETGYHLNDCCWKIARYIPFWYKASVNKQNTIGYILKSILYLLRCRRFDGKKFLSKAHEPKRYEQFSKCLSARVHPKHEKLRKLTKKYLDNKGTIDGLPVD